MSFLRSRLRKMKEKHKKLIFSTKKSFCEFISPPRPTLILPVNFTNQKIKRLACRFPSQDDMTSFYNTPPLGTRGTCSYLTKVVMNLLLEGEVKPSSDDPCLVS